MNYYRYFIFGFFMLLFCSCHHQSKTKDSTASQESPSSPIFQSDDANETDKPNNNVMEGHFLLIILDSAQPADKKITDELPVQQQISPKVKVVHLEAIQAASLSQKPGIYVLKEGKLPEKAALSLSDTEILFAQSWLMSTSESEKDRKGDGLNWDMEGFQPPDSLGQE